VLHLQLISANIHAVKEPLRLAPRRSDNPQLAQVSTLFEGFINRA